MFSILRKGNPAFYGTYPTAHIFQNYNLVHVSDNLFWMASKHSVSARPFFATVCSCIFFKQNIWKSRLTGERKLKISRNT